MTPDQLVKAKASLIKHEGKSNKLYQDSKGIWTIGCGYNIQVRGLSDEWVYSQLQSDIEYFYNQLNNTFSWFKDLNHDRQIVLIDMSFMGFQRLLGFKEMFNHLSVHDYKGAALEMLASEWADDVGQRAVELAHAMSIGEYNV